MDLWGVIVPIRIPLDAVTTVRGIGCMGVDGLWFGTGVVFRVGCVVSVLTLGDRTKLAVLGDFNLLFDEGVRNVLFEEAAGDTGGIDLFAEFKTV